ncbi:alpha 1,2-mannosyltransferase 2.4.1 [Friedmanniomyces endolithicus]|uniref:Alpha 1,2-mannosyltransferase 2.4.1 n=1 Tax=Friedmanniomyces endolithicus TaxID=329885 RepID=A0AAN6FJT9_9PEZI|nr:alpha 1,2-mannosyltransferase 2.4.1 [Friedmanniomyces endolithicus]KAK0290069.1 alpha 1,2-mannosyltransferase 2.4.1 [Friedmanniomyces endolithicus]KAK0318466.1 alpha 1,2-mannosyltransferase 2.4.1 [Friedmanniomyces endolithicus]
MTYAPPRSLSPSTTRRASTEASTEKGEKGDGYQYDRAEWTGPSNMAGSQRVFRYVLLAVVALVVIFFVSASSGVGPGSGYTQKASELLKGQGSVYEGSGSNSVPAAGQDSKAGSGSNANPIDVVKSVVAPLQTAASSNTHDTTSPNPLSSTSSNSPLGQTASGPRMNATFVTLARNSDVWDISRSIRQVEDRFNHAYNYDWVFLNDADFDDTFVKVTSALTSGRTRYGKIDSEHWGFPSFIDQEKARKVREDMHERKIIYGDSVSYRHMCRYESGFFFRHKLMQEYEWYWRVEPSIELFCDIKYDPFKFMADNKKKYSFVLSLYEYVETIPTLWDSVKGFMKAHPEHIVADNSLAFLSDDGGESYNHCHFWSNFEVGNLDWLRSPAYVDYFNHLDRDGGFFYERWGDAPVHSIAAGLMLKKEEIHFFNDIAYYHVPFTHCPTGEQLRLDNKCHCNPRDNFDWNGYSCTKRFFEVNKMSLPEGYEKEQ